MTVLESTDVIGGISQTIRHNEQRIDIGGHRLFPNDERVMRWWRDILPYQGALSKDDKLLGREARTVEGGPDPEQTDEVFLIRHRVSRIYYGGKFFDYLYCICRNCLHRCNNLDPSMVMAFTAIDCLEGRMTKQER